MVAEATTLTTHDKHVSSSSVSSSGGGNRAVIDMLDDDADSDISAEEMNEAEIEYLSDDEFIPASTELLEIKQSHQQGAGYGLFARRRFERNGVITDYGGTLLSLQEINDRYPPDATHGDPLRCYVYGITRQWYRDARYTYGSFGRWINMPPRGVNANARLVPNRRTLTISVRALRHIEPGEEITVAYNRPGDRPPAARHLSVSAAAFPVAPSDHLPSSVPRRVVDPSFNVSSSSSSGLVPVPVNAIQASDASPEVTPNITAPRTRQLSTRELLDKLNARTAEQREAMLLAGASWQDSTSNSRTTR